MPYDLHTPILSKSGRRLHYFNGRVLTAEDLQVEQETLRQRDDSLGRALGEGVIEGLEVYKADTMRPAVTISAGLALNRAGQVLTLVENVTINVVPEDEAADPGDALFVPCPEASTGTPIPVGTGAYVLLAALAAGTERLAPRVGLADDGVARSCETRFVVEGVQFRLVYLDLDDGPSVPESIRAPLRDLLQQVSLNETQEARLRNLLAHWCLGTGSPPAAHAHDLYDRLSRGPSRAVRYGPLDELRAAGESDPNRITDCDTPLALLYWTSSGIRFVDMWAVRRRLHRRDAAAQTAPGATDRRRAEGEAAFHQFQRHLTDLVGAPPSATALGRVDAANYFPHLPAVGVLPVLPAAGGGDDLRFFTGLLRRAPAFLDGHRVPALLDHAFTYPPVTTAERELVWLYAVRQNRQAEGAAAPTSYIVFASGHLPFLGDPLYNVARWDFAHYGPGINADFTLGG